jgi:hypothetical protein
MILQLLYALGVMLIPFNGVKGVNALGELSHELSAYVLMPVVLLAIAWYTIALVMDLRRGVTLIRNGDPIIRIFAFILILICLTVIANVSRISISEFHERSGFAKFAASALVLFYGMGLSYATYKVVPGNWQKSIIVPVALSAILCLAYSSVEVLYHQGLLAAVYKKLNAVVHASNNNLVLSWNGKINMRMAEGWDQRIRSLCFEPPAFGNFSGFAWPWLLAGVMSNTGRAKTIYSMILALFTVLIIVAQARTGWVMLACNLGVLGLLRFIFLSPVRGQYDQRVVNRLLAGVATMAIIGGAIYIAKFDSVVEKVINGDSVSNLSRLASQVAAVSIFKDHPILGVGFGQYGFYVNQYMPSWGYLSYELRPWLIYPTAPWPAVYSMYARLACETGLVGLISWIGLWLYMSYLIILKSRLFLQIHGNLPAMAYPLVMSYSSVLISGVASDTLRTPMIWISLGLGCAYLNHLSLSSKVRGNPQDVAARAEKRSSK